jgi:hypothetical protein
MLCRVPFLQFFVVYLKILHHVLFVLHFISTMNNSQDKIDFLTMKLTFFSIHRSVLQHNEVKPKYIIYIVSLIFPEKIINFLTTILF